MKFNFLYAALFTVISALPAHAYFGTPGTQVKVPKSQSNGSPYGFLEYLPVGYSEAAGSAKVPVVLFLHGLGEMGDGENNSYINNNLITGVPASIANGSLKLPAIVLSPQTPTWWNANTIDSFVNYIFATYKNADPSRLYVTGLSMGGGGTWDYAFAHPQRVAAIVPICGAGQQNLSAFYGKGVWSFHAFNDPTVSVWNTINNMNSITPPSTSIMTGYPGVNGAAAANHMTMLFSNGQQNHQWINGEYVGDSSHDKLARFTLYKDGGHGIWGRAYANQDMWNWLFTWTNSGAPAPSPSPVSTPKPSPSPVATPKPTLTPTPTPVPPSAVAFTSGKIDIDFGSSYNGTLLGNRALDAIARGGQLTQLVKQDKVKTTAGLTILQGFNGLNQNGTASPAVSTGFDGGSSSDSFFGNDVTFNGAVAPAAALAITGLDPSRRYDLRFYASRMGAGGENRETRYSATGANSGVALLNVAENTSGVAVISGIQPNSAGTISLDVRKGPKNNNHYGFYYLGAMSLSVQAAAPSPSPTATPNPAAAQEIRVDFGSNGPALPAGWNNGRGIAEAGSISLKNSSGAATSASLLTLARFNSFNQNGTTAPASALNLPVAAVQDSFYGNDVSFGGVIAAKAVMELRGLDPAKTYSLEFFASRMASDGLNRETVYRAIGAATVAGNLNVTNNTSQSVRLSVKPNASGVIRLEFQKGAANNVSQGFFYLGNLRIRYQ